MGGWRWGWGRHEGRLADPFWEVSVALFSAEPVPARRVIAQVPLPWQCRRGSVECTHTARLFSATGPCCVKHGGRKKKTSGTEAKRKTAAVDVAS